jgi:hypothetical protein
MMRWIEPLLFLILAAFFYFLINAVLHQKARTELLMEQRQILLQQKEELLREQKALLEAGERLRFENDIPPRSLHRRALVR